MAEELISEIGISSQGELFIRPANKTFPYIYREAMQVSWDPALGYLYSPPPREWSHLDWFQQICSAALEQGADLVIGPRTKWRDVPENIRVEIIKVAKARS
ncbi:hypothetical protein EIB18_19780 [Caulobacter vibrioides]|uniref:hypothetical protein n=1 Tax=Caulobacter vibrioides TaxID=155892 RepID=UPI000F5C2B31|nr:hypothetical protein [Caulobacter vibrioides]AZH14719.1 hypothetical protein EIB18_19780 [Caulobacter vibrioides]